MSVIDFIHKHPEISRTFIEEKCEIPSGTLYNVLAGRRDLPAKYEPAVKKLLSFYGYSEKNNLREKAA